MANQIRDKKLICSPFPCFMSHSKGVERLGLGSQIGLAMNFYLYQLSNLRTSVHSSIKQARIYLIRC